MVVAVTFAYLLSDNYFLLWNRGTRYFEPALALRGSI